MAKKYFSKGVTIPLNLDMAQSSGGKTGSVRVQDEKSNNFQYKPPITENSLIRRVKANFTDSENFAEVLAARIAKSFDTEGRVPPVLFVIDFNSPYVAIVSKYLTGGEGAIVKSLDDYLEKPANISHIKLVSGPSNPQKGHYNIDEYPLLKKELAQAIAISALVGDLDVNPGNMIVIKEKDGRIRIGRIDYGHAFKDLMRFSSFGGKTVHNNNIIDFFNRERVDGKNSKSKLWRDYPGLVPSREMVEALKNLSNEEAVDKITQGINEIQDEFRELLAFPHLNKNKTHLIRSFQRIAEHVSGEKISSSLDDESKINAIFNKLQAYVQINRDQMAYAAEIMDLQVKIQEAVKSGHDTANDIAPLKEKYENLVKEGENKKLGPFTWIKDSEKKPPFKGNFEQFVEYQKTTEKFNKLVSEIDSFLKENPPEHEAVLANELKAILTNPKKTVENKILLLDKKVQKLDDDPQPKSGLFSRLIKSFKELFSLAENKTVVSALKEEKTQLAAGFKDFKSRLQETLNPEEPESHSSHNNLKTP